MGCQPLFCIMKALIRPQVNVRQLMHLPNGRKRLQTGNKIVTVLS
ncbi:hypothetical protein EUBSIR_01031 [[Eubacterium] siraeum DSM 15702]|uniref:Uncharacterized protein n=1 Tax=[Eubacterium] siraeum DSM 15702 TaxID=428128 RepID=B0MMI2_9FIRM|nr:hypothetical protein EUBSIR_01031 [[Eubacterium] siraeum DSM 15702]